MKGGNLYAVFIGHQSNGIGGGFDLFNLVDPSEYKNILHGSTVGIKTINRLGIKKVLDKFGNPVKLGEDTKGGTQMKLQQVGSNQTKLVLNDGTEVFFSYETPVAALVREETLEGTRWHQYKTDTYYSRTTSKHINQWNPRGGAYGIKPQSFFDALVK